MVGFVALAGSFMGLRFFLDVSLHRQYKIYLSFLV